MIFEFILICYNFQFFLITLQFLQSLCQPTFFKQKRYFDRKKSLFNKQFENIADKRAEFGRKIIALRSLALSLFIVVNFGSFELNNSEANKVKPNN
jgi:hypothetical protein